MTAASTQPTALTAAFATPDRSASTSPPAISAPARLCLDEARTSLAAAANALDGWYARQTTKRHCYVADGHEVIRLMDAATRELHRVHTALVGEIRADEHERAIRVDRMIADFKARPAGDLPAGPNGPARRDGGAA